MRSGSLAFVLAAAHALAPSFDSFLSRSTGSWRGVGYSWSPTESDGLMPLGVTPGHITPPDHVSCVVSEVMRSCGGAVQGVRENLQGGGEVYLNRQSEGFSFFSSGSYALAPASLGDSVASDFGGLGLSVCLSHCDGQRRRLLVALVGPELVTCDVAIEALESDPQLPDAAQALLGGRLQMVVDANAWEGGASTQCISGAPPGGAGPWLNARTQWASSKIAVASGAPLLPNAAIEGNTFLPGGCFVSVRDDRGEEGGRLRVEVGSCAADAAEVKSLAHEWGEGGLLQLVEYRTTVAEESL